MTPAAAAPVAQPPTGEEISDRQAADTIAPSRPAPVADPQDAPGAPPNPDRPPDPPADPSLPRLPDHPGRPAATRPGEFAVVNHSVPRLDGNAKVTGQARYASDVTLPRMAHAAIVRSPYAHARIVGIDISAALARPGVLAVLTGDDIAKLPSPRYGHAIADHPVLAIDKVRFAGEPVAAVIAIDERTAQEATFEVDVEYEELRPLIDVDDAAGADAPAIHEQRYAEGAFSGLYLADEEEESHGQRESLRNVCHHTHLEWGDVERAFAEAAHVAEATYDFPRVYAYAMEPYVAVADYSAAGLTVHSSAQHPYLVRTDLKNIFGLPLSKVRMVVPYIGGGYGSKSYTKIEPLVAACSMKVRRPVKLQLSVEEAILTTRVAGARMRHRTAADADGRIVAREATLLFDGGAYAENSPHGAHLSAIHGLGGYRIPNVRIDAYVIYTNTAPASSYRGFGSTQVNFAAESQLDELAEQVGMDRLAFRVANMIAKGEQVNDPDTRPLDGDLRRDIQLAAQAVGWGQPLAPGRGRGIATMILAAGAFPVSTSEVRVHSDGSISVLTGTTELGQGSETVFAQIAAEEFGVPLSAVNVVRSDTSATPFERSTGASRSTTVQGRALLAACNDAKERLRAMAADAYEVTLDAIETVRGGIRHGDTIRTWGEIVDAYFGMRSVEAVGTGHVRKTGDLALWPVFWELSSVGVEVAVDAETGRVRLEQLSTVGDVGLAMHPAMMEGQDLGAAIQGLGPALFEELRYDGQQLANGSLLLYRVPRFSDVPRDPRLILIEDRDGVGPYGAKGGGEGAISPMAPAIANAVYEATGVRFRTLPLTPERVWRGIREARTGVAGTEVGR